LRRIIEEAMAITSHLPRPGLWFVIDDIEVHGRPPKRIRVWLTLHLFQQELPFCCSEPLCHLGAGSDWREEVGNRVRLAMSLRQSVHFHIAGAKAHIHDGVSSLHER
jgi:hypothetical protein